MKYFAYGSNMSLPRLQQRTPGARRLSMASLTAHTLRFHKVSSVDGSAKCNALYTGVPQHCIFGALFEIPHAEKPLLDSAEGLGFGYAEKAIQVHDANGKCHDALTYYATHIDDSLQPYSWYLQHVILGARETGVPADYLEQIMATRSIPDSDQTRNARERAIYRSPAS